MSSQDIQPTQNWIQSYLVPPDAKAVRGLLRMASRGSERSCCSQHKVIPTILVATALSALNATLFYPGRAVFRCLAEAFDWKILRGLYALAYDVFNSLRSLALTAILIVCLAIAIFYPRIIQKINPRLHHHESQAAVAGASRPPLRENTTEPIETNDRPVLPPVVPVTIEGPDPKTYELRRENMQLTTKVSLLEMDIIARDNKLRQKEIELEELTRQTAYEKSLDGRAELEKQLKDALSELQALKKPA